ncbi:MAG TPA: sulfatase-like hydrolase/transferase, partial [Methyloceanibacter sp.]|nr:sulfatase-like hydrolase/transferase [Methyloceanibacter sp.]
EITLLFALLALAPRLRAGRPGQLAACLAALATTLVAVSKIAELAMRESLARPLNPLLDLHLARSLVHLLTETLGGVLGWLSIAGLALLPLLVFAAAWAALRAAQRALERPIARYATLAAGAILLGLFTVQQMAPQALGPHRLVSDHASITLLRQLRLAEQVQASLQSFESAMAQDRFRAVPAERLLARLGGTDVLLMFIESYGRSALELPRYARSLLPTLEAFDERLAEQGVHAASAWLTSPTVGGQSWLAHGTLESGLWLPDQAHYEALIQSERLTLTRAFARAGHRTVALKPAITRPWPEGAHLGFAQVYAAADLGYAGKPYNWVTMPDQYTLAVLERAERSGAQAPLFAEVSLISSHAPWTPIAPVLEDWSAIGDGSVFSRWADDGDAPEVVWRDPERVREQYARAIDYVLRVLASYAANFVDGRTLLILVGDHQPAPLITGEGASRDVPIHVISGDPALLAPFEAWGFTPGMRPPPGAPVRPMDAFRDFFLDAFTTLSDAAVAGSPP